VQCFTYSCACEAYEARRIYRKSLTSASTEAAGIRQDSSTDAVLSRFGFSGVACDGKLIVLPRPSPEEDDGSQPFDGRLGKLRYLGLAVMAAAGAVASDLVQIVLPFPAEKKNVDGSATDVENPLRAPIAYPVLFGHVLTHVVAAMCSACGRGRARSDALELVGSISFNSSRGSFTLPDDDLSGNAVDSVTEDCEGFMKLGVVARTLQVLLGRLRIPPTGLGNSVGSALSEFQSIFAELESEVAGAEMAWIRTCHKLLNVALSSELPTKADQREEGTASDWKYRSPGKEVFREACSAAAVASSDFLVDAGMIMQLLIPGVMARYQTDSDVSVPGTSTTAKGPIDDGFGNGFETLGQYFRMETVEEMIESALAKEIVANWYGSACRHAHAGTEAAADSASDEVNATSRTLRSRLYRTQGFRHLDWPSAGFMDSSWDGTDGGKAKALLRKDSLTDGGGTDGGGGNNLKSPPGSSGVGPERQPHDDDDDDDDAAVPPTPMQVENVVHPHRNSQTTFAELLYAQSDPSLVTFSSKKTVPLLGGVSADCAVSLKTGGGQREKHRPRVAVIPTSYTDLYAELGALLPDCEQTAVCLICGAVLNAGGKGECTKHSYKCGAGAGMFFLLQECSGLIMHKSKAAYIHSPYVDSHGETPQFRGRPLNLDLVRYEHLREVWMGHAIRQTVVAERGSSRQVILPDFY